MALDLLPDDHGLWACTIIARNYLPAARVLASSFLSHHPTGRLFVLVLDDPLRQLDGGDELFDVMHLDDLEIEHRELHHMAASYGLVELATAVKPWLLDTLLQKGTPTTIYLDPDIEVFGSLDELSRLAEEHGIVLTPHVTAPMPRDGKMTSETSILAAGIYNLGFLGVSQSADPFLQFWKRRLLRECVIDPTNMRFVDQRWVDFVPGIFDCHIHRDPSCNVGYWNLDHRELTFDGDRFEVNGRPLTFFHFSGYSPDAPHLLSKFQTDESPRILLSERPVVRQICDRYGELLLQNGFGVDDAHPYGLDRMANGVTFDQIVRELYRRWLAEAESGERPPLPDPFDPDGAEDLVRLLNEPPDHPGDLGQLSTYQVTLYGRRPDLRLRFPDPQGRDRHSFFAFLQETVEAGGLHPALALPPASARLHTVPPGPGDPRALDDWDPPDQLHPGVMLVGYLRAELGVGQGARLLADALDAAHVPYATLVDTSPVSRQNHRFAGTANDGRRDFNVNIVSMNADQLPAFSGLTGPGFFVGRYTIGQWAWELETFPEEFHAALNLVDEVWAVSEFTRAAIAAVTDKPVFAVPHAIAPPAVPASVDRTTFGIPENRTVFLFCFDLLSVFERKNPLGLVESFSRAFEEDGGAMLVLKVINGDKCVPDLERLRLAVADRRDILLMEDYLDADMLSALMASVDCYVSLHRSEGFGLTMAEAMALGKPVIATAYSGNLDFMSADTAYLVRWTAGTVPAGCPPYPEGSVWANPDVDDAARLMRHVHEHPEEAREVGRRAKDAVTAGHSTGQRAEFVRQRFDAIQRLRTEGTLNDLNRTPALPIPTPGTVDPEALVALAGSRPPLEATSRRLPRLTRFYRRIVLRLQRHHDDHQRQVNVALAQAVQTLAANDQRLHSDAGGITSMVAAVRTDLSRVLGEHDRAIESLLSNASSTHARLSALTDRTEKLTASLNELVLDVRSIPDLREPSALEAWDDASRRMR